jgi:ABC-type Fe3+-hydroxamate transport system substrate-binding protein
MSNVELRSLWIRATTLRAPFRLCANAQRQMALREVLCVDERMAGMRIVSLCPSLTELAFDLGRGDDVVGVTRYCVHPAAGVARVEKVGGTKDPKIGRMVELAPDVVLMNEEENRLEDAEALTRAGIRCHTSQPRTVDDVAAMVRSIGAELGRPEEAERIARDVEERSRRVREAARGRPRVRWAYLIWRKPWMAVNRDTLIDSLLTQAGGHNVFGDRPERYPAVTAADLVAVRPDVVLLSTEPFPFEAKHVEELAGETGFSPNRFRIVDGELLSWHGSRTPAGVDYSEEVIRRASLSLGRRAMSR